jgi:LacI family transcriptional regulator, galactose operon repressor
MKRPTIKDVAAHAGVSKATVSLVLRESPQIPEATKARVRESMEAVGYVYNRRAAEMRGLSSKTIGLVVANVRNPYFAELTMAVEERAHASGYTLILGCSADALDRQDAVLRAMAEQQVDGIILLPASHTTPASLTEALGRRGMPHALVARSVPGYDCDYAGSDNEAGGRVVGEHLRTIGARRVAFLGGVEPSVPRSDRMRGLMQGLAPDVTALCADVPSEHDASVGHAHLVDRALHATDLPDAIVAYNDMHAFTIMSALRSRGIEPGRDVSVASFDNVPEAAQQYPSLTTADGFPTRVGAAATEMVLDRIAAGSSHPMRHTLIQPELRIRQSTTLSTLSAAVPTA